MNGLKIVRRVVGMPLNSNCAFEKKRKEPIGIAELRTTMYGHGSLLSYFRVVFCCITVLYRIPLWSYNNSAY